MNLKAKREAKIAMLKDSRRYPESENESPAPLGTSLPETADKLANYDAELVDHFLDSSRIGESVPGQYAHELARVAVAEHTRLNSLRRQAVEAILAKPLPGGMSKMGETAFEQGKFEAIDILNTNFPDCGEKL